MNHMLCAWVTIATYPIFCFSFESQSTQPLCVMNGDFMTHIIDLNGIKWWLVREKFQRLRMRE